MPKFPKKILAVPTTIVTGFLGAGKTSAILHFLKHKPVEERWAVLVNEFGKIGVDGSLYQGCYGEENGVFVGEVQGGCMCCSANLPMQIALNKLLAVARPQRLLIEPTGLGHPLEILKILKGKHYRDVLSIQKILTLVDARNLVKQQYIEHDTFNQQIEIADVIVGNKADLYSDADGQRLTSYIKEKSSNQTQLTFTMFGELDQSYLEGSTAHTTTQPRHDDHAVENLDSIGWRFSANKIFDKAKVVAFMSALKKVKRVKAVFITEQGIFGFNLTSGSLSEMRLKNCLDSRIEIIAEQTNPQWENQLSKCFYAKNV